MILHINSSEYDYHTLVKVAEMAGLAGLVGFHESEDGYIVSFPDTENTQALINDYKARLRDLENNIWQHQTATNSKAGFGPPFLYAKSFLCGCLTRFGRDELIHRRILGFQIVERYHAVAHLDNAVTPAGVAQK